jgi:hypothetical protein
MCDHCESLDFSVIEHDRILSVIASQVLNETALRVLCQAHTQFLLHSLEEILVQDETILNGNKARFVIGVLRARFFHIVDFRSKNTNECLVEKFELIRYLNDALLGEMLLFHGHLLDERVSQCVVIIIHQLARLFACLLHSPHSQ